MGEKILPLLNVFIAQKVIGLVYVTVQLFIPQLQSVKFTSLVISLQTLDVVVSTPLSRVMISHLDVIARSSDGKEQLQSCFRRVSQCFINQRPFNFF